MANTLGQATAGTGKAMGFSNEQVEQFKHPSYWEFLTRDVGTGYASMWHGASEIIYGKRGVENNNQPQDQPVIGGMLSRFQKGTIGEGAAKARENMLSDTSLKTLESAGITWRPTPSDPEIDAARLTRREYAQYQTMMNKAINEAIASASDTPEFKDPKTTTARKQQIIEKHLEPKRVTVRAEMKGVHLPPGAIPDRRKKLIDQGKLIPRSN
jgi:hypothetical protein